MARISSVPWSPDWVPASYSAIPPRGLVWARWGSGQPGQGVHGFTDDWRLESIARGAFGGQGEGRVWAIEPDFSVRPGMPEVVVRWQVYRSRYCGDLLRSRGLQVVPVLSWADASCPVWWSAWGVAPQSCVAVRAPSCHVVEREAWAVGYRQVVAWVQPAAVLVFGRASRVRGVLDAVGVPWRQEFLRQATRSRRS